MAKVDVRIDEDSGSDTQCEVTDHHDGLSGTVALKSEIDSLGMWETVKKFKNAIFICNILCLTALADGYQYNLSGSIIANKGFINHVGTPDKNGEPVIESNHVVIWGALQSLGEVIGMVTLTPISDHYGRKTTMLVIWFILIGALILETVFHNWKEWAGSKVFAAIGIGGIQATLPVYVTELSPVNIRGGMIFIYAFWYTVGKVFANMVLMVVQETTPNNFRIPILTQWALLGIMLPVCLWIPESPAFYAEHDRDQEGKKILARVNGKVSGYNVEKEYQILKNMIVHERKVLEKGGQPQGGPIKRLLKPYAECFNRANLRRTVGASLPACAQQLSGLALLNTYASVFFKQCGFDNAFLVVTVMCAIQFVAVIILIFVTDKFGRRNMVCVSLVVCTLALLVIGVLYFVDKSQAIKTLLMVVACIWSFASAVIGTIGYAFVGEVASQKLRTTTAGVASGLSLIFGLIFYTVTPVLLDEERANWGYKTALLFFGFSTIGCVLLFLFLPECSQRNAAEIDEMFEKGVMAWNMHKYTTDVQKQLKEMQCHSPYQE